MKIFQLFGIGMLILALAIATGCNNKQSGTAKGTEKSTMKGSTEDDHDHGPGPHNGTIIEFGKWHGEFTVNHKTKEATIYILGGDAKKAVAIQVEKLQLSIKTPQFQLDLLPVPQDGDADGKSSRFVGKHENFGKEQEFEGTLSGVVNGKPYAGDFKEEAHKDPKQIKK